MKTARLRDQSPLIERLFVRQETGSTQLKRLLTERADLASLRQAKSAYVKLPQSTRSTIALDVAPNGNLASTHGDHTIRVTCCHTGHVLHTLVGHPRTPWSVRFHPSDSHILASGCIGHECRIWCLRSPPLITQRNSRADSRQSSNYCLRQAVLDMPVISVSFHATQALLGVGTLHSMYIWNYQTLAQPQLEITFTHQLRCVCFPPNPGQIILALSNDHTTAAHPSESTLLHNQSKTFHLSVWNFSTSRALTPKKRDRPHLTGQALCPSFAFMHVSSLTPLTLSPLSSPRTLLSRTYLFNDNGLDIAACGRYLVTCAELRKRQLRRLGTLAVSRSDIGATNTAIQTAEAHKDASRLEHTPGPEMVMNNEARREAKCGAGSDSREWLPSLHQEAACVGGAQLERLRGVFEDTDLGWHTRGRGGGLSMPRTPTQEGRHCRSIWPICMPKLPCTCVHGDGSPHGEELMAGVYLVKISLEALATPEAADDGSGMFSSGPLRHQARPLAAMPIAGVQPTLITSVKLSPSGAAVLVGYGRRTVGAIAGGAATLVGNIYHMRTFRQLASLHSESDDVNIARFHPFSGHGYLYGSKQGRIRAFGHLLAGLEGSRLASQEVNGSE